MNKPLVWAHRGASGYAPENTLPAFQQAVDMKAVGVELDIQLTKDGEIVVCHDERIDRTSDGIGYVRDFTLAELKEFDFSNGMADFTGAEIPTMEEVFDLLDYPDFTINIELKTGVYFYPGIEEKIIKLTHDKGWQDRVIYSSFNHYSILKIKELDPEAKTGFLYGDGILNVAEYAKNAGVDALHPAFFNLQYPGMMDECKRLGIKVHPWTINKKEDMKKAAELGVDAIITNYPDIAVRLYEQE